VGIPSLVRREAWAFYLATEDLVVVPTLGTRSAAICWPSLSYYGSRQAALEKILSFTFLSSIEDLLGLYGIPK
jgi:hypothetical protein